MKRKLKNKDWKDEILPLSSFFWKKTTQIKTKQDVRYIDRLKDIFIIVQPKVDRFYE